MSLRTVLVIVLALVCGVTAAIGISAVLKSTPAAAQTPETVPVVVAVAELGRFTNLTPDHVKIKDLPKDLVPDGSISKPEDVYGRSVVVPMVKGEPLLQKKLSEKGFRGIEPAIQDGMRAVTVLTTNMAAGVAGFVLPGSKVDVILTLTDAGNTASTFVLLENVEVLASQQFVAPPNEKLNVGDLQCVTLLVTKEQSMKVALAQSRGGNLQLVLRNPKDEKPMPEDVVKLADLYPNSQRPQPPQPAPVEKEDKPKVEEPTPEPPPQPAELRILRGLSESTVQYFPAEGQRQVKPRGAAID